MFLCRFYCLLFCRFFCQMLLLPFCKFPLPFLTPIEGQNVRQDAAGNGLDPVLRNVCVIDQLLSSQRSPPSGLSASSCWQRCRRQSVEGFAPFTILLQIPLQNSTSLPFPFRKTQRDKHSGRGHFPAKSPFSACCRSGDFSCWKYPKPAPASLRIVSNRKFPPAIFEKPLSNFKLRGMIKMP